MDETARRLREQFGDWAEMIREIPAMQGAVRLGLDRHMARPDPARRRRGEMDQLRSLLAIFQQKYTFDIIFVLRGMGHLYFNDLRAALDDVNPTSLSRRLKDLEARGFVTREVHQGQPVRVSYALTQKGDGTFDLLLPMLIYVQHADLFERLDVNAVFDGE
ncbi:MAG: helix-turn-helix transcriptional regulator [Candidatus Lokiarchaeota archaeon]|nr:helix-turn-helix transcriptional regulator [Candidatus Lokiarchaeota archaeon]